MAASSKSRSRSGPVLNAFQRSSSPASFYSSSTSSAASGFASSTSSFSSRTSPFFNQRPTSPTRVHLARPTPQAPSVRFSLDARPTSPGRSFAVADAKKPIAAARRRTCMCSPTSHPGSFRCSLHKNQSHSRSSGPSPSNQLNMRRSAMTNSLVRIGTVEGDLVKRALAALVRPCAHSQRRRNGFQPRPSRLSIMSKAEDSAVVISEDVPLHEKPTKGALEKQLESKKSKDARATRIRRTIRCMSNKDVTDNKIALNSKSDQTIVN